MAGYSKRTLVDKLGIRTGMTVAVVDAPVHLHELLGSLPSGVELIGAGSPADMLLCFATSAPALEQGFRSHFDLLPSDAAYWACWPKRASKIPTDITEDVCRDLFLPLGLVDVKVCAIDDTWSGLKFVVRKEHRDGWPGPEATRST